MLSVYFARGTEDRKYSCLINMSSMWGHDGRYLMAVNDIATYSLMGSTPSIVAQAFV